MPSRKWVCIGGVVPEGLLRYSEAAYLSFFCSSFPCPTDATVQCIDCFS